MFNPLSGCCPALWFLWGKLCSLCVKFHRPIIAFRCSKVSEGEVLCKHRVAVLSYRCLSCVMNSGRSNSSYCFVRLFLQLPPVLWSVKSVTTFLLSCQRQTQKRASLKSPSQQQKLWNWHSSRSHHLHRKRYVFNSTQCPLVLQHGEMLPLICIRCVMGCWDRATNYKDD